MERGTITISRDSVTVTGNVWMADYAIADLFGVTFSAVGSNIKSIYTIAVAWDIFSFFKILSINISPLSSVELLLELNVYPNIAIELGSSNLHEANHTPRSLDVLLPPTRLSDSIFLSTSIHLLDNSTTRCTLALRSHDK